MQSPAVSESATSLALACVDIIIEIIEQTSFPSDGALCPEYDRPLLSTLALVCRAFHGPANKALWSRLESFVPLLALFAAFDNRVTTSAYVRHCHI